MTKKASWFASILIFALTGNVSVAVAQAQDAASKDAATSATNNTAVKLTDLLAQAHRSRRSGFVLMPASGVPEGAVVNIAPMASGPSLPVTGGGTLGRLTKWTGFTSSNSVIGDTTIYEDKFGKVGIGTDSPTSRLTVAGRIEATGGFKFPDGSVQTSSATGALFSVTHDATLAGDGTTASPLSVSSPLMIRDLDNPARQPVQAKATCTSDFVGCSADLLSVPAGKRLVIEFVSMVGDFNISGANARLIVTTNVGSQQVDFACNSGSALGLGNPKVVISQSVRLYADPGTVVSFSGQSNSGVSHTYKFSLSGYLIDIP